MAKATYAKVGTTPARHAYLALAVGVVCIAMSAIFVKWAAVPGPASAFYRVFFAAIVLVPWWLRQMPARLPRATVLLALLGGVFFALDLVLWNMSLLIVSAANATLLANNAPLWVGLAALVLFRERLSWSFWLGLAIALIGAGLILGGDVLRHPQLGWGDLLAISASLFYAAYLLTAQFTRSRLNTLTVMTLSVMTSVVVLLAVCLALDIPLLGYNGQTWTALLGLGLVSQVGGWLAINYALGYLRATVVSVSLLSQSILTALLSIPLLGEYLSIVQIVGGALVLTGIYLVHQRSE